MLGNAFSSDITEDGPSDNEQQLLHTLLGRTVMLGNAFSSDFTENGPSDNNEQLLLGRTVELGNALSSDITCTGEGLSDNERRALQQQRIIVAPSS